MWYITSLTHNKARRNITQCLLSVPRFLDVLGLFQTDTTQLNGAVRYAGIHLVASQLPRGEKLERAAHCVENANRIVVLAYHSVCLCPIGGRYLVVQQLEPWSQSHFGTGYFISAYAPRYYHSDPHERLPDMQQIRYIGDANMRTQLLRGLL